MSAPTSAQVGMPVTVTFDGTITAVPVPVITTGQAGKDVKYVPTPGAADNN